MARPISGKNFDCIVCKNSFYRNKGDIKRGRTYYCSINCAAINRRGKNNPKWKGGKTFSSHGYVLVRLPEMKIYKYEHRLVMEKHLKRKLLRSETIHHIDGNKSNNHISNLKIMSLSEHQKYHNERLTERHCWVCEEVGLKHTHYCRGFCQRHYELYLRRMKRMKWW